MQAGDAALSAAGPAQVSRFMQRRGTQSPTTNLTELVGEMLKKKSFAGKASAFGCKK